jgi:chromatin modification-related protein EAF6
MPRESAPANATATATATSASGGDSDLSTLLLRRNELEQNLAEVEQQIADLEERYYEQTHTYGNAVRGWEGFMTCRLPRPNPHATAARRPAPKLTEKDRMFSMSSATCTVVSG